MNDWATLKRSPKRAKKEFFPMFKDKDLPLMANKLSENIVEADYDDDV